jgi:hypothetical protein
VKNGVFQLGGNVNMSIYDDIKNGKYAVKLEYPKMIRYNCQSCNKSIDRSSKFCSNCGIETNFEHLNMERKLSLKEYNKEENRMYGVFKEDCLKEVDLENHPKREDIFNFAFEKGHSAGYHEVFSYLVDLSELFK